MALLYEAATVVPSKLDLLRSWVPAQPWLAGADATELSAVGAYRFDDPDGEVGIETHLLRTRDGRLVQVPLTYRSAPVEHAPLVGTAEHTVLGPRWVYDATRDPVYATALATAILTGGHEAALELASGGTRAPMTRVRGSGRPGTPVPAVRALTARDAPGTTEMSGEEAVLVLRRVLDVAVETRGASTLRGSWPGQDESEVLALFAGVPGT